MHWLSGVICKCVYFVMRHLPKYLRVASTSCADIAAVPNTSGLLSTFLLAMILHPEVQKKAQEEIDRVVGSERLPVIAE